MIELPKPAYSYVLHGHAGAPYGDLWSEVQMRTTINAALEAAAKVYDTMTGADADTVERLTTERDSMLLAEEAAKNAFEHLLQEKHEIARSESSLRRSLEIALEQNRALRLELAKPRASPPQDAQPSDKLRDAAYDTAFPPSGELGDRFMEILRAVHGDMPNAFADSARLAFVHALKEAQPVPEPLTNEQIGRCMVEVDDPLLWGRLGDQCVVIAKQFARAIERIVVQRMKGQG